MSVIVSFKCTYIFYSKITNIENISFKQLRFLGMYKHEVL